VPILALDGCLKAVFPFKVKSTKAIIAFVLTVLIIGIQIEAQTNITPIISTNFVTANSSFREVNGQLYNINRSLRWDDVGGDVLEVLTNGIVLQKYDRVPAAYGANEYGQRIVTAYDKIPGLKLVVQNYDTKNTAVGETIWVRAIQVGTIDYKGQKLELWDHGTPHIVAVVTTNYLPRLKSKK
jgi:hypothetical protein